MPLETAIRGDATRRAYVNARLVDPSQDLDTTGGVIIADGRMDQPVQRALAGQGTVIE